MDNVPVIDMAGDRETAVAALDAALRQYGFFYLTNHGIPSDLIREQFRVAGDLFDLSLQEKQSMPFDPELDIGYVGSGVQSLNPDGSVQIVGDTKEQMMMTNNKLITTTSTTDITADSGSADVTIDPYNVFEGSNNYEPNVKDHEQVTRDYGSAAYRLNLQLNDLLFDALQLQKDDASSSSLRTTLGSNPFMVLKQMKYAGDPSDPDRGKFGAGAHTDWGSFTILATDGTPGLQIQMNGGDGGHGSSSWLPVPPKRDCLIINSGDQIAQLTNDTYRSAMHRVVTTSSKPRFSTAVFTYFGIGAVVEPLPSTVTTENPAKYPSGRTTREYFHFKLKESMGTGGY